jgi:hypothetical protein
MANEHPKRRATDREGAGDDFQACPRYERHELTEEQVEQLATRAAAKAITLAKADLYQGVGKTVIGGILWIIGICSIGLFILAAKMGWVKI